MREFFQQVYDSARHALSAVRSAADLKRLVGRFHQRADDLASRGFAETRATWACCADCCYCCYLKVDAKPDEVFRIMDYIRQNFSADQIAAVRIWGRVRPQPRLRAYCQLQNRGNCLHSPRFCKSSALTRVSAGGPRVRHGGCRDACRSGGSQGS